MHWSIVHQNMNNFGCYIINDNHHNALGYKLNTILDKSYGRTTMASRWKEITVSLKLCIFWMYQNGNSLLQKILFSNSYPMLSVILCGNFTFILYVLCNTLSILKPHCLSFVVEMQKGGILVYFYAKKPSLQNQQTFPFCRAKLTNFKLLQSFCILLLSQ